MADNQTSIVITAVDQASAVLKGVSKSATSVAAAAAQRRARPAGALGVTARQHDRRRRRSRRFRDLSQKTGATVESLALKSHARAAGVDLAAVGSGLSSCQKHARSIGRDWRSKLMFSALGVSIKNSDGSLRDSNAVMDSAKARRSIV
jgi:hypothetical protein